LKKIKNNLNGRDIKMAKNKDTRSFNRTGLFDYEKMTITAEDKKGVYVYDLKELLKNLDGEEVSIAGSADFTADVVLEKE
jgi:hypothetical protein